MCQWFGRKHTRSLHNRRYISLKVTFSKQNHVSTLSEGLSWNYKGCISLICCMCNISNNAWIQFCNNIYKIIFNDSNSCRERGERSCIVNLSGLTNNTTAVIITVDWGSNSQPICYEADVVSITIKRLRINYCGIVVDDIMHCILYCLER